MEDLGLAIANVQVRLIELAKDIQDRATTEVLASRVVAALEAARLAQELNERRSP